METIKIDTKFDIESFVFLKLKKYLSEKSKFIVNADEQVFPKSPKQLAKFPCVVFKETGNVDKIQYRSLDRREQVNQITDTIEIYTQDMTIDGVRYASKYILSELKYLVFDFFEILGATRIDSTPAEYSERQVDRYVIVERYLQNNWNRKID